jgi:hypothetical protein
VRISLRKAALALATAGVAVVLLPGPAQAGEFKIPDPAGDATGVHTVESTPRPSDPELDILNVAYFSDGKDLKIDLKMAKIGQPVGSAGYTYRVNFTHGGTQYQFLYQVLEGPFNTPGFFFRSGAAGNEVTCKCSGKVNGKTATLEIRADIASMSRGIKAFDSSAPPIGPGTKFTKLNNSADRILGILVAADLANAKPEQAFVI